MPIKKDIAQLRTAILALAPFEELAPEAQEELLGRAEVLRFGRGHYVFRQGDRDPYAYYLLAGELEMDCDGQLVKRVIGGTDTARYALAQLQPRQLTALALCPVTVLRLERALIEQISTAADLDVTGALPEVEEIEREQQADWMTQLLRSELFARLPAANIQRLFKRLEPIELQAGEVVVEQGSPGEFYYIVRRGRCEVTRTSPSGRREIRLAMLSAGDRFGEEALISNATRNATVTMLCDGELMRLTRRDFADLIHQPVLRGVKRVQAETLARSGYTWLDVRFPEQFARARIAGSINLPLNLLRMHASRLEAETSYICCSEHGKDAAVAAFLLLERGFHAVYLEQPIRDLARAAPANAAAPALENRKAKAPGAGVRVSVLQVELAEVNARLQEAQKLKADAETARVKLEREVEARIQRERTALEARASQAAEALREADRLKQEAEAARREAQADAERIRGNEEEAASQLEQARRLKQEAEAARVQAEEESKERLREERERLAREAARAAEALEEAQRLKLELEEAKQRAEQELERRRQEEEEKISQLREATEQRLREEEARLKQVYAWKADELEQLQRLKEEAEARLRQEREQISSEAQQSRERLEEARRIQREIREQRLEDAEQTEQLHAEQAAAEQRMQDEIKQRIGEERQRLEEEFARSQQQLEHAQREREAAEAARAAAAAEAERIIAEYRAEHEKRRAEEEARLQAERDRLETEARRIQATLEEAARAKREALKLRHEAEQQITELQAVRAKAAARTAEARERMQAELDAAEARASRAREQMEAANRVQELAQAAQQVNTRGMQRQEAEETKLREQLQQELNEWLQEQEDFANSPAQQKLAREREALMERISDRAEKARRAKREHDANLLADLQAQLREAEAED